MAIITGSKVKFVDIESGPMISNPDDSTVYFVKDDQELYLGSDLISNASSASGGVTGVKGDAESTYRTGDVNITPANIGAKGIQSAVTDPVASGDALTFIDTIEQDVNGVITPTKKSVQEASASQAGVVSTGTQTFAGQKTFEDELTVESDSSNPTISFIYDGDRVGSVYGDSNGGVAITNPPVGNYTEEFRLPAPDSSISADQSYQLLSSRDPVTMSQGGTSATNGATGLGNLLAAGNTILSSYQYGATLPAAGNTGRIFFKTSGSNTLYVDSSLPGVGIGVVPTVAYQVTIKDDWKLDSGAGINMQETYDIEDDSYKQITQSMKSYRCPTSGYTGTAPLNDSAFTEGQFLVLKRNSNSYSVLATSADGRLLSRTCTNGAWTAWNQASYITDSKTYSVSFTAGTPGTRVAQQTWTSTTLGYTPRRSEIQYVSAGNAFYGITWTRAGTVYLDVYRAQSTSSSGGSIHVLIYH